MTDHLKWRFPKIEDSIGYHCSPENTNYPQMPPPSPGDSVAFCVETGPVPLFTPYSTLAKTDTKVSSLLLSINLF